MKKTLLIGCVLFLTLAVNAQHFGIQAGGSLANMTWESDAISLNTKIKPAFFMGVTVDFPLNNSMVVNTALNYKHSGTWIKQDQDVMAVRLNYINLDVTYNYLLELGGIQLFFEGGGYFGYAVSGKTVYKPEEGDKEEEKLNFGTADDDDMKALDIGIIVGAGVYFGKAKLGINYEPGLLNLAPNQDANYTIRNSVVVLKATYFFNKD
jgi:hypothetical protein